MDLLVDGNNVLGSRPDGWWRDRPAARRRLVAQLAQLGRPLVVVFDGRPVASDQDLGEGTPVEVRFAPGGPDAADRVIEALVASAADPGCLTVATSDRDLARRVRALGATVEGAGGFLAHLPPAAGTPAS